MKMNICIKIFSIILILIFCIIGCSLNDDMNDKEQGTGNEEILLENETNEIEDYSYLLEDDGDYYVLGGDMLLDKKDPGHQMLINVLQGKVNSKGLGQTYIDTWPNSEIPYYFDDDSLTDAEKETITNAMLTVEMACNVNFYESTPGINRYRIIRNTDPYSGGASTIGYAMNPVFKFGQDHHGVVMHELLHCLGLFHEHQRYDRGDYISITETNIRSGYEDEYEEIPKIIGFGYESILFGEYDYDSIMHYGRSGNFAKNPFIDIITPLTDDVEIGQRDHLSNRDREALIALYGPPDNRYFSGNISQGSGNELLIISNWGIGLQKYNSFEFNTEFFKANETMLGSWELNSNENTIEGIGDFNGDGEDDILISSNWGLGILTKSGDSFITLCAKQSGTNLDGYMLGGAGSKIVGIGDFDGDGDDDILIKSYYSIAILTLSGTTLVPLVVKPTGSIFGSWIYDTSNIIQGIGNFNGKEGDDILITSAWGIGILRLDGNTFKTIVCKPNFTRFGGWLYGYGNTIHGIGDFDGDGDDDFIIISKWGIGILTHIANQIMGSTLTSLVCKSNYTRFGGWLYGYGNTIRGIGNFDGTGGDDILITSKWGIGILKLNGNSLKSIVCKKSGTWFGNWKYDKQHIIHGVDDLDNNGRADIIISSNTGMGLLTLSGNSMTSFVQRVYASPWWNWNH